MLFTELRGKFQWWSALSYSQYESRHALSKEWPPASFECGGSGCGRIANCATANRNPKTGIPIARSSIFGHPEAGIEPGQPSFVRWSAKNFSPRVDGELLLVTNNTSVLEQIFNEPSIVLVTKKQLQCVPRNHCASKNRNYSMQEISLNTRVTSHCYIWNSRIFRYTKILLSSCRFDFSIANCNGYHVNQITHLPFILLNSTYDIIILSVIHST